MNLLSVDAPARLHFGLFQPFGPLPQAPEIPAFGGVGLMVDAFGPRIRMCSADEVEFGAENARMEAFVRCWLAHHPDPGSRPFRMSETRSTPAHSGLGSGTALAMAVGRALSEWYGLGLDPVETAGRVGRGERSAIGIYGARHGGLIVDAGKRAGQTVSDLAVAAAMPSHWRVVVALPKSAETVWHGARERQAFADLTADPDAVRRTLDRLSRVVLLDLLPAARTADLDRFGEAAFETNTRVGEFFAPVQGGLYASSEIAEVVEHFRTRRGIRGVGQSSWGPAVFAIVEGDRGAEESERFDRRFGTSWKAYDCEISHEGTRVTRSPDDTLDPAC